MAGHIIAVLGGKGGVGKSVFAANLAAAYQLNFKQGPMLVDLDLNSCGDQNLIWGLNPAKSIVDVSKYHVGNFDAKAIGQFMVQSPSGVRFISAPRDSISAREMDVDGLGRFAKALPSIFNITIVDCGNTLDAHVVKVLEYATAIFVVSTPDVIVVNQTKKILSKIQELLFPAEMVQVVLNRYGNNQIVSPQMIQKSLNKALFHAIPDDIVSSDSALAKSTPVTLLNNNAPISKAYNDLVRKMQQTNMLEQLAKLKKPSGAAAKVQAQGPQLTVIQGGGAGGGPGATQPQAYDPWRSMKERVSASILDLPELKSINDELQDPRKGPVIREKTQKAILDVLATEDTATLLSTRDLKAQMVKEILDEVLGLGPLEDLLRDKTVSEIMVNSRDQIYVERNGTNTISKVTFTNEGAMRRVIERILLPLGRRCDTQSPFVDARLADGSRVHVIIPPLALRGPTITIRKFPSKRPEIKDLIQYGSMTPEMGDFLRICVESERNIIVSGGTGSGKTTLLNVLSNFIPATKRIITVEDSAELQLGQEHVVRLETRPKGIEGNNEVNIRDLVKCCLRMRPDRIVVGECRGGEALDMLQAMNTGHGGSLTTVHSNSPRECLGRLETLVMMADLGLPSQAIRDTIASAVQIIVQQSRLGDGSRKVIAITEVAGIQGDSVTLNPIFEYKQEGWDPATKKVKGRFVPTGNMPKFFEELEREKGIKIDRKMFMAK